MKWFNHWIKKLFFCVIAIGSLTLINSDITHYENRFEINRTLYPDVDGKGMILLTPEIGLKQGNYTIKLTGETDGTQNAVVIFDGDTIALSELVPHGEFESVVTFKSEKPSGKFRIGVNFDPETSTYITVREIEVHSENVLYKESFLRHAILSLFVLLVFFILFVRIFYSDKWKKVFGRHWSLEKERVFFFVLFLTIVTSYPLLIKDSFILADDMQFHLSRIEGIAESLKAGYFPPRIHLFIFNNYGYGSGFYYPEFFLYIPAIFRLLGFPVMTVYKGFVILCSFLSILSIYTVTRKLTEKPLPAVIAAILFASAAYRLTNIYYRGALGEIQSGIFFPWVFLGVVEILYGKTGKSRIFTAAFLGLALSHLISLLLAVIFTFFCFLFNAGRLIKEPKRIRSILQSILIVFGITAFFFIPMIEQYQKNDTPANILLSPSAGGITEERVLNLSDMFSKFNDWSSEGAFLGWPLLFLPFLALLISREKTRQRTIADVALLLGFATAFIGTKVFPWEFFPWLFNRIQFTFRLLMISTPLLSIAGGVYWSMLAERKNSKLILTLFAVSTILCTLPIFIETTENRIVKTRAFFLQNNRAGGGEFLPRNADREFIDKNKNTVLSDSETVKILSFDRQKLSFTFDFVQEKQTSSPISFEVPILYYYGYSAQLERNDGSVTPLPTALGRHGLVSVSIEAGISEGSVTVSYHQTPLQIISDCISLCSVLIVIVFLWMEQNKKRVFGIN